MKSQYQGNDQMDPLDSEGIPFRISSVDRLPEMVQEESCRVIKRYFDHLESTLAQNNAHIDVEQLRELLTEINGFIGSDKSQLKADGYMRMLNRLTDIYAKGVQLEDDRAFTGTAANYADIMNTISHNYTGYDYSQSIALMLHYMDKLFSNREESWFDIYQHLVSMPDSIHVLQLLKEQHLQEIQCWVEEGVDNLFSIWEEQLEVLQNIGDEIHQTDREILLLCRQLSSGKAHSFASNIYYLEDGRRRRALADLREKRRELDTAREAKLDLTALLDDNIQEFGTRLTEIRRNTQIQLVWDESTQR
ncbi:MAG: hypothetical protein G8D61_06890 [gamma proteobacterium symbiont of Ctena orbiculata]|nr:hypothetical protein [Candidatus Thiodiazotropha sp. (ex Lucina pensylvanica)]MBV2095443.1 hypothetical protein [Candidatus Thiodiazotropha sp. (ex Codakia orbicularis)]PUB75740.1 MAG: hypothetical protein DBP03_06315 [gamma proteobacterium symbiont of Ctena orbiculata]PUB77316.1 MAG: hypothetical protein DBO99_11345 [gamma proteobacterium symbiont of Ctena orbiculata]